MECLKKVQAGTIVQRREKRGETYEKWLRNKLRAEKKLIQKYQKGLELINVNKMPKLWEFVNSNFTKPVIGTHPIPSQ